MPQSLFAATRPGDLAVTIVDQPLIDFGPEIAADLPNALRREWLVTNSLGGYASGTVAGVNTRRYHGLLVAALAARLIHTGTATWSGFGLTARCRSGQSRCPMRCSNGASGWRMDRTRLTF